MAAIGTFLQFWNVSESGSYWLNFRQSGSVHVVIHSGSKYRHSCPSFNSLMSVGAFPVVRRGFP